MWAVPYMRLDLDVKLLFCEMEGKALVHAMGVVGLLRQCVVLRLFGWGWVVGLEDTLDAGLEVCLSW